MTRITQTTLTLVAVALLASACATTNSKRFIGTWKLDLDRTIALNPKLQELVKNPGARKTLDELAQKGSFTVGKDTVDVDPGNGTVKHSKYTVVKDEGDTLIINNLPEGESTPRRLTISFETDSLIKVLFDDEERRVIMRRVK